MATGTVAGFTLTWWMDLQGKRSVQRPGYPVTDYCPNGCLLLVLRYTTVTCLLQRASLYSALSKWSPACTPLSNPCGEAHATLSSCRSQSGRPAERCTLNPRT